MIAEIVIAHRFRPRIFSVMGQEHTDQTGKTDATGKSLEQFVETVDAFQATIGRLNERYRDLELRYLGLNDQLEAANRRLQRAAEENRRFGEYLDRILKGIDLGVVAVDEAGIVRFFNPAAESFLGLSQTHAIGAEFSELLPDIHQALSKGTPDRSQYEVNRTCPESGRMLELSIGQSLFSGEQGVGGAIYVIRDLTAARATEKEMGRLKTLAALGEMSATLAHEIKNPLTGIVGYCGLLLRDLEEGPQKKWAERIEEGVNRLDSLIMNMLEFARTPHLDHRPIKWRSFGEEIANAFESGAAPRKIRLKRKFPRQWPESTGDPSLLRQAVLNLLHNAEQAIGEDGEIQLRIAAPGSEQVILEVADNGPGMPQEVARNIFRPFYTTREHGTGLGLAIARKIVEAHGGSIEVHSQPGQGTRFRIALPNRRWPIHKPESTVTVNRRKDD